MFHEESRFQTKRENKRRGDTNKCHGQVGKRTDDRRKRLDGYKYKRGNVGLTEESGKRRTIVHIPALLNGNDMR